MAYPSNQLGISVDGGTIAPLVYHEVKSDPAYQTTSPGALESNCAATSVVLDGGGGHAIEVFARHVAQSISSGNTQGVWIITIKIA